MDRRSTLASLILVVTLCGGCDKSGLHPLGKPKDVIVACGAESSSWLRSVESGTEGVVLGVSDPATLDDAIAQGDVCFHAFHVAHDSTAWLESGVLMRARGRYQAIVRHVYSFDYRPDVKLIRRPGASRDDLSPLSVLPVEIALEGDQLLVEFDGSPKRLTRVSEILGRLDPSATAIDAPGGPKDIYRMFALTLFTSLVRVPGFGSTGMTTYVKTPVSFAGLLSGGFTVSLESIPNPTTHIEYFEFHDLDGIVLRGLQTTAVDFSGNGPMRGVIEADFHLDPADIGAGAPWIEAEIDYGGIVVGNGVASDGHYLITYGGNSHVLDYTLAVDQDLTAILPISEGVP